MCEKEFCTEDCGKREMCPVCGVTGLLASDMKECPDEEKQEARDDG